MSKIVSNSLKSELVQFFLDQTLGIKTSFSLPPAQTKCPVTQVNFKNMALGESVTAKLPG